MVVIHYTAMQSCAAALKTLCNPDTEVSAHYLIAEDGEVLSLVPEALRAWHAGAGRWGAVTDVNSRSIGIELANPGDSPFAAAQMDALSELLVGITTRWDIRPERVIGHSDMAPGRKIDPGPRFDWRRLALLGLSVWPSPDAGGCDTDTLADFDNAAVRFGYSPDMSHDLRLCSFRLRFRPHVAGPVQPIDIAMAHDLADRFPVDANAAWV